MNKFSLSIIILPFFIIPKSLTAQAIEGNVYDFTYRQPMPTVFVYSSSGQYAITDSAGKYSIPVNEKSDSIWFSYNGKNTVKYPIDTIKNPVQFDIGLHVNIPFPSNWLRPITVYTKNYRIDSIQNRIDNEKLFGYEKPGLAPATIGGLSGFDLDQIIESFNFRKTRRMERHRNMLIEDEQRKYIDHRFTKKLVKQLTPITDDARLDDFMKWARPDYELLISMNDLQFGQYIQKMYKKYRQIKKRNVFIEND
jgi:plasmid maintenance system killer protein